MHLLGIDYGQKHVGVALATTFVAEAFEVVPTSKVIDRLGRLIQEYHIDALVLGLSENQMGEQIKVFGQQLTDAFHLPIHYQDETLSSQDTRRRLAQLGVKRSTRQAKTDHYVAAEILQNYLDSVTMR